MRNTGSCNSRTRLGNESEIKALILPVLSMLPYLSRQLPSSHIVSNTTTFTSPFVSSTNPTAVSQYAQSSQFVLRNVRFSSSGSGLSHFNSSPLMQQAKFESLIDKWYFIQKKIFRSSHDSQDVLHWAIMHHLHGTHDLRRRCATNHRKGRL